MPETIIKHATKTALTLMAFAVFFTAIMTYVYFITKAPIAEGEAAARRSLFAQITPAALHDNDLLNDTVTVEASALLGTKGKTAINIARINKQPSAVILEAIAPDGYAGEIKLLIAIKADSSISGVRVITHKETPGLGDYIDIAKNSWITIFNGASINQYAKGAWKVKKDGGEFDYMVGATITPRAVVKAVHKALQYFEQNKDVLFAPKRQSETVITPANEQKELSK